MARSFLTPINLNLNQILNTVLQLFASAPTSQAGVTGQIGYFSTLNYSATYNGTAWVPHDASKLVGAIPMAALTVDPTLRANHTGTQLASTISNLATTVQAYSLSSFGAPTANIALGGYTFTGLPAATGAGQPLEYSQGQAMVQSAAAGISSKTPVNAVATSNVTSLSGTQTIDGVALAVGQRVLLTAQTTASQNGPYVVQSGTWTRPTTEGTVTGELDPGATWLILGGTVYADTSWRMNTTGTITPGTTSITIVQSQAASVYAAGNGLTLVGTAFTVLPVSAGGITVSAAGVAIDPTVAARHYAATIGDGSTLSYTVAHSLNTRDVNVQVYQTASPYQTVEVDVGRVDVNTLSVAFATAPASGAYRVVVVG